MLAETPRLERSVLSRTIATETPTDASVGVGTPLKVHLTPFPSVPIRRPIATVQHPGNRIAAMS